MCGITGYFYLNSERPAERDIISSMTDLLKHRGPDHRNIYLDGNLALGHRRLSIIDLSESGNQPLSNEDGSVWTVFNGELYNFPQLRSELEANGHVFKSDCDTEVIVHAYEEWGTGCFKRFDGMLAAAIYDKRNKRLILGRDRFGKKPLYYTVQNGILGFASEIKALLNHPAVEPVFSSTAVRRYLAYEYVPAPDSIYENIYKLGAAEYIDISTAGDWDGLIEPKTYWFLNFAPKLNISIGEACSTLRELLIKAVEKRLISDVPLGVFLSGGIDSSAIVWAMSQVREAAGIQTYTIGFDEGSFDESSYARQVADHFGTRHNERQFTSGELLEIMPQVCAMLDEPFADPSILPTYLLSRFAREQVTVALGGDGGDELFAGYDPFVAHRLAGAMELVPEPVVRGLLKLLKNWPASDRNMSWDFRLRHFLKGFTSETRKRPELRNQLWLGPYTLDRMKNWQNGSFSLEQLYKPTLANVDHDIDSIDRLSNIYLKTYMADDILVKIDRASMFNSLEVRSPFLDTELVEFAARLPVQFKMQGLNTKVLLKQAFRGLLPDQIIDRPKKGFGIPLAKWLRNEITVDARKALYNLTDWDKGLFKSEELQTLLDEHTSGAVDRRKEIWTMMMINETVVNSISNGIG